MAATAAGLLATAEDVGKAGPIGLFLILSLLIAVLLLGRSMRTHLRRVPTEFPPPQPPTQPGPAHPQPGMQPPPVIEGDIVDEPPDARRTGSDRDTP